MLTCCAMLLLQSPVSVVRDGQKVVVDNGQISLAIDRRTGAYGLSWGRVAAIEGAAGEARLPDGQIRRTTAYSEHEIGPKDVRNVRDKFGTGVQVTLHHRSEGQPELRQTFWIYRGRPEAIVRLDAVSSAPIETNYLSPVVTETSLRFVHRNPLQSLFVPYDNDMYFRYRSDGWGEGEGDGDGSYEVGAVYDDGSRTGLVVGSLDHEVWKSAVRFKRSATGKVTALRGYAGVTSKYTHDREPHGSVAGREVQSPRFVVGFYDDWRRGLDRYGDLNAIVKPPLPWPGSPPFGWSSWSGHKSKIKAEHAQAATDFVAKDIPWFRSGGTAYINLDSFWDTLSRAQRLAFVEHAHAAGLKAGIYYTPFCAWGNLTDRVHGKPYAYSDLVLKDARGQPLPRLDGAWPLDPTHPATLARIDEQLDEFIALGFDYVKLDFMSHGALEGRHADPSVTTGAAAYAAGMRHIVEKLSPKKIFISLSIAPMFPNGYAHSRRISCDVFANIGATEYLLNSATYGWWTAGRIYRFNDPDSACVYQPMDEPPVSEAESRSRFTASIVAGGMMLEGDDLTSPAARERVMSIYSNRALLDLARRAPAFRPVFGDTATKAGDAFVWVEPGGKSAYVAVFNYDKAQPLSKSLSLSRLGLTGGARWTVHNLWTGAERQIDGELNLQIAPTDCSIVRLYYK